VLLLSNAFSKWVYVCLCFARFDDRRGDSRECFGMCKSFKWMIRGRPLYKGVCERCIAQLEKKECVEVKECVQRRPLSSWIAMVKGKTRKGRETGGYRMGCQVPSQSVACIAGGGNKALNLVWVGNSN
jgi:hypothetical protein